MNLQAVLSGGSQPLARRAALTVHALGRADRVWLLAQLPAENRERLEAMLKELTTLGIPADRTLLDDVVGAEAAAPMPPTTPGPAAPAANAETAQHSLVGLAQQQAALCRLDAAVLVKLLHKEPAGLIARLLNSHAWPWRDAMLEQLGAVKRRRVEELLDSLRRQVRPKAPEALHKTLIEALYIRVADLAKLAQRDEAASRTVPTAPARMSSWMAPLPERLRPWIASRS